MLIKKRKTKKKFLQPVSMDAAMPMAGAEEKHWKVNQNQHENNPNWTPVFFSSG